MRDHGCVVAGTRRRSKTARIGAAVIGLGLALVAPALEARAGDPASANEGFDRPLGAVGGGMDSPFTLGARLFDLDWAIAPGPKPGFDGIGPLFNRLSCDGCHTLAGRGAPPRAADFPMISMVVRLSVPGVGPDGGPRPHPVYGQQLDRNGIPGVPAEGQASVSYTEEPGHYADGAPYSLRRPHYRFTELHYGPLGPDTLVSARVAPQLAGLGLLDAVPEATLLALAAEEARGGVVRGRPNRVPDVATGRIVLGRFGWKAGQPSLRQQNADAFMLDIGITNPLYPTNDCTSAETACLAAAKAAPRHPKIADRFLDAITFYVGHLAPPAPRGAEDPAVERGARLFRAIGCAACHRPTLETGASPDAALAYQTIHPYSDLLLHDMGPGLADHRPEYQADGRSWRTPPLWGLGLIRKVNGHEFLLHDGRARGPAEAILWHGGEATAARDAFWRLPKADRDALVAFLNSL